MQIKVKKTCYHCTNHLFVIVLITEYNHGDHIVKVTDILEGVQRRFLKMIDGYADITYDERLV